jgi:hypothetical protein
MLLNNPNILEIDVVIPTVFDKLLIKVPILDREVVIVSVLVIRRTKVPILEIAVVIPTVSAKNTNLNTSFVIEVVIPTVLANARVKVPILDTVVVIPIVFAIDLKKLSPSEGTEIPILTKYGSISSKRRNALLRVYIRFIRNLYRQADTKF